MLSENLGQRLTVLNAIPKQDRLKLISKMNQDNWLFVGIDPSLSSSGWAIFTVRDGKPIILDANKIKTLPGDPTPKRLQEILDIVDEKIAIAAARFKIPAVNKTSDFKVVVVFEEPPPNSSSSAWLYALNQLLWTHFANPQCESLKDASEVFLWCINSMQVKSLYYNLPDLPSGTTYDDLKKHKSAVVKTVTAAFTADATLTSLVNARKFSHDVIEAVFFACQGANIHSDGLLFPSMYSSKVSEFMLAPKPNAKGEDRSWLMRPLEFFFYRTHE